MTRENTPLAKLLILVNIIIAASSSSAAAVVAAQNEAGEHEPQHWYRIELLIFKHNSTMAQNSETWEASPQLSYPPNSRFLLDPNLVMSNLALFDATSTMDERGHQTLTIIPPVTEGGAVTDAQGHPVGGPGLSDPQTVNFEQTPIQRQPSEELNGGSTREGAALPLENTLAATPTPFTILANSELEFSGKAALMQRSGRYRILFHETWVQPIRDKNEALPIVIERSGDTQDWPLLQGSIKFYLSRYLHVETNLWLNTSGHYLPRGWRMPAPPRGPASLSIIYPPKPQPELQTIAIQSAFYSPGKVQSPVYSSSERAEPLEPVYPWRHAIALHQKRKMRSAELHYIDHPMLGVVVKISPLDEDALLQRAKAETASHLSEAALLQPEAAARNN